jgi:hypothetical protein
MRRKKDGLPLELWPHHEHGCPTSRSFLARCGTDEYCPELLIGCEVLGGESGGIPHLAKNERDVGHPLKGWTLQLYFSTALLW